MDRGVQKAWASNTQQRQRPSPYARPHRQIRKRPESTGAGSGKVLYHESFLEDPWRRLLSSDASRTYMRFLTETLVFRFCHPDHKRQIN